MDFLIVALSAAFAAGLTLFSGFGLGTLLLPVFALFFPVEVAVAATALVHGANNVFKVTLLGRFADRETVLKFGIPGILAAIAGAGLLGLFATFEPLLQYELAGKEATITPIRLVIAVLMLGFAFFELAPRLRGIQFQQQHFLLGGLLSGFFGGLSGHQGALRAAFLAKSGLDTPGFVGTSSVIGLLVDMTRITTYAVMFFAAGGVPTFGMEAWPLVITGCLAAFTGVLLGKRFLHRLKISGIQILTGLLLLVIALLLGAGLL